MTKAAARPLVLAVAPNGSRKTKTDHPALPMTPDEVAHTAAACLEAGAAMIHLHVRDKDGGHSLDAEAYRAAIAALRRDLGQRIVIQITTEAVGIYSPAEQMACVRAVRPEAASLAIRELFCDEIDEREAADFLAWVAAERITPQYILYSADDVTRFEALKARGIIPQEKAFRIYVLGRYSEGQRSTPADLLPFLAAHSGEDPEDPDPWALCAFGSQETACAIAAACLGGHARVGFENNTLLPDGTTAPDNAALVAACAAGARAIARPLADADQARAIMAGIL